MCGAYIKVILEGGAKGRAICTVKGLYSLEARERANVGARAFAIPSTFSESVTHGSQTPCLTAAGHVLSARHLVRVAVYACRSFFRVFDCGEVRA